MDGVQQVAKWKDSTGGLHDSEEAARQAQARIVVRNVVCEAVDFTRKTVDVELLAERRGPLIDALRRIERGK